MAETRDEFEEAWARIVEDLTRSDAEGDAASGTQALFDTSSLFDSGALAGPGAQTDAGSLTDPGAETDPRAAAGPASSADAGAAADSAEPEAPADSAPPGDTGTPADAPTSGAARVDPGLAALFEPLHREQPAPDSFVDSWDDEGHFVAPEPPELPEGTPVKRLAWAGTLGGPAVLVLGALSGWDPPAVVNLGAGLAFLAGFATLVWQMPESREDGWDDGARL